MKKITVLLFFKKLFLEFSQKQFEYEVRFDICIYNKKQKKISDYL